MEEMTKERTCTMCVLCLREDYGYSNYTVEGTTLECLAGLNPEMSGKDAQDTRHRWNEAEFDALAPILDVAKTCPRFREGAPATLDVDKEDIPYTQVGGKWGCHNVTAESIIAANYTDDREAAELLVARFTTE